MLNKFLANTSNEMLQIVYDKFPSYCTTCNYQGHNKDEYRLTLEIEGTFFDETKLIEKRFNEICNKFWMTRRKLVPFKKI